ncbi:SpoIIE family protein phosphatase [Streptomyces sp. DSM 44917]|uniref:SpoIIE family protein phosphatase n=1 Tax=Streptomyces boetiae TaxID=3075541 RepID=A0ABU2LDC6_9ACTN|nr:SpoIIE family protein phosphatase [Streptomyces sp. DSM 44917]MDT0309584.1 SpoIIE family protein phosphatase [Streptomyces sp. DSM 44917]
MSSETVRGREWEERLRLLAAMEEDQSDTNLLTAALQQATAGLGALGGMAHLRAAGALRLVGLMASSGLPPALLRLWEAVAMDGTSAPSRAIREGATVWLPSVESPEQALDRPWRKGETRLPPSGTGILSVPLLRPDDGGLPGSLSVFTVPGHEPRADEREFFEEIARLTGGRLRLTSPTPENLPPDLLNDLRDDPQLRNRLPGVAGDTFEWNLLTGAIRVTEALREAFPGIDPAAFNGRIEDWVSVIHPGDLPWVLTEVERGIRGAGAYEVEHRVRQADGSYGWVRLRGRVVEHGDKGPARVVGTLSNTTETHAALESVGRALRHMTDGFLAVDGEWRISFVNAAAEALLGSAREVMGRRLWDLPVMGRVAHLRERCEQAARDRAPADFDVPWPEGDRWYHLRLVPVPDGLTLYISDITRERRDEAEREAARRAAAERAGLVAAITRALAEAVTARDVVAAMADSLLPPFGAEGLVVLALRDGQLSLVGARGYPEGFREHLDAVMAASDGESPPGRALRVKEPLFIESAEEHAEDYPVVAALAELSAKRAWAFLPLAVTGRQIGVVVLSFDRPHRFTEDERTLLTVISGLIAQALERASLFDRAVTRARELQRALLPQVLPSLPAVEASARYFPAGEGTEVGGDWYDVIPLSSDRVGLVMGDVMGHGMAQAAIMGRLRTAARTLSELELDPEDILGHLDDIVGDLGEDCYATCLYGVYDPVTGDFDYGSAGHLPPVVARPDGGTALPTEAPNPPLGIAAPPFDTVKLRLPPGSLLAFCTDGLVEAPGRDIGQGLARLAALLGEAVRSGRAGDLEALCDGLTADLMPERGGSGSDDAALLVARTRQYDEADVATWRLPEEPVAAGEARDHVRAQLAAWGLGGDLEMTTELIVSELVGNVVRHAKGPVHLRLLRSRSLIVEVSDGSLTTPHIRRTSAADEGGRGLQLVAAMAQRWGARYTPVGKCIWTEQPIP